MGVAQFLAIVHRRLDSLFLVLAEFQRVGQAVEPRCAKESARHARVGAPPAASVAAALG
jgi:hypothetical protein